MTMGTIQQEALLVYLRGLLEQCEAGYVVLTGIDTTEYDSAPRQGRISFSWRSK